MASLLWKGGGNINLAACSLEETLNGVCLQALPKCEIEEKYQAGGQSFKDRTESNSFSFDLGQWNLTISSAFEDIFLAYFYSTSK